MSNISLDDLPCPPSSSSAVPPLPGFATDSDFPPAPENTFLQDTQDSQRLDEEEERCYEYPLANSTSLIEVIRDDEDHIDIEAEEAAYRAFDLDDSDDSTLGFSDPSLPSCNARPKRSNTTPTHDLPLTRSLSASRPGKLQTQTQTQTRQRPPSSIFSHDIWVGENGDAEKDGSFARGVRIVGWTSVGDKRGGAYVVYDCAILTHALTTIHIHKRYSAFLALHTSLTSPSSPYALPKHVRNQVLPLPPRTALARFRPGFLEGRRRALQAWLSTVLLHPEIGGCKAVREWVMAG